MSKIIYRPTGRAKEYSHWAANIFVGCSNMCAYCYCKQGPLKSALGMDKPQLKKGLIVKPRSNSKADRFQAYLEERRKIKQIYNRELEQNEEKIRAEGSSMFLTFTTDPCSQKPVNTFLIHKDCALTTLGCDENGNRNTAITPIPVIFLTKCAEWVDTAEGQLLLKAGGRNLCIGFTLTGRDDLEPNASSNAERIEAMRKCHEAGVRTFASIEPVIDLDLSFEMIKATVGFCDEYKIGLLSGKRFGKPFTLNDLILFVNSVQTLVASEAPNAVIYWKESVRNKVAGLVQYSDNVVDENYNIFNH